MLTPPPAVVWEQCVVRIDHSALSNRDRKLSRKAQRKVNRLTGITFRKNKHNPIPGIRVEYSWTDNFAIAQTATQSSNGWILWSGITLFNEYHTVTEKRKVIIHELLHAVGVQHTGNKDSIMYYQHLPGQKITPGLRDRLSKKYSHCKPQSRR